MTQNKSMRQSHYATTTDTRVLQSREALRKAFLYWLNRKPYKSISIRQITDRAGVGYNTFFRHHSNKDELLKEVAADEIKCLIDLSMAALGEVNTKEAADAICGYVANNRGLWSALLAAGAVDTLREEFIRLSWIHAEKRIKGTEDIPTEVGVLLVASGTIELLAWWLRQKKPISVAKLSAIYEELVVAPTMRHYK